MQIYPEIIDHSYLRSLSSSWIDYIEPKFEILKKSNRCYYNTSNRIGYKKYRY